jgi:hypothetical protein
VKPFLGFADDQMKRLLGQKNVHRAELEDKHGYDTKYAMHVIRLYGEAKELMESGRITLPRPNRDELIEIRRGKYSLTEIRELGAQLESEVLAAQVTSPLPDKVDQDEVSRLLADAHLRFWSESGGQSTEFQMAQLAISAWRIRTSQRLGRGGRGRRLSRRRRGPGKRSWTLQCLSEGHRHERSGAVRQE